MPRGCMHLDDYKRIEGTKTFRVLHAIFVIRANPEARKTKVQNAICYVCQRTGPYMHTCMHCVYFACHKHIREHGRVHNHSLDLIYGQVYCFKCRDYVYDRDIERISSDNKLKAGVWRKRLFQWTSWNPNQEELELLKYKSKVICITPESTIGFRGLLNLGNTCFMNCIIQALTHTPLLRDYFMAERHRCKGIDGMCLVCELSKLFQEFYKGESTPIALSRFLYLTWKHAHHLAGYYQQDAHEFFMSTLQVLDNQCLQAEGAQKGSIIEQVFRGTLQSDLVCQNCNGISTKEDPIWDLSLELSGEFLQQTRSSSLSLIDCLERFTRMEHLHPDTAIMCGKCKSYQQATKQLTIKSLPVVVTFHLKRFLTHLKRTDKISTLVSFPEMLDMTPFLTPNKTMSPIPPDNRYCLFAVISHSGSIDGGHYVAYIRQQRDYWYRCNDDKIMRTNLSQVLAAEGYLLFYHKHILAYE